MKNNNIIDKDTKKLIENCIKLHYYANPETMLQENKFKYLILEESTIGEDIKDANISSKEIEQVIKEFKIIVDNIFEIARENKKSGEGKGINFENKAAIDKYLENLNNKIKLNIKKITKVSASTKSDDKSPRSVKKITGSIANVRVQTKGLIESILDSFKLNIFNQITDEQNIISTADKDQAEQIHNQIIKRLQKTFNSFQKKLDKILNFFKFKINKKFDKNIFDFLAGALLFIPKNQIKDIENKLNNLKNQIDEPSLESGNESAASSVTDKKSDSSEKAALSNETGSIASSAANKELNSSGNTTSSKEKKSNKGSDPISKVIDNWYINLDKERVNKIRLKNAYFKTAPSILKKSIKNNANDILKQAENQINSSIESWFNEISSEPNKDEMEAIKKELRPQIFDAILKLKQESKFSLNKKFINKLVKSYLNNKFKSKKIINESLISRNNNCKENSINFKRINQLAGLE